MVGTKINRIANDKTAELVLRYPDRFMAALTHISMKKVEDFLKRLYRVIIELGFGGVQITTTIMDKPLHSPEFEPLFEKMNYYNLPVKR